MSLPNHEGEFILEPDSSFPQIGYSFSDMKEKARATGEYEIKGILTRSDGYNLRYTVCYTTRNSSSVADDSGVTIEWSELPDSGENGVFLAIISGYDQPDLKLHDTDNNLIQKDTPKYYYIAAATDLKKNPNVAEESLEGWNNVKLSIRPKELDNARTYHQLYHAMLTKPEFDEPTNTLTVRPISVLDNDRFTIDNLAAVDEDFKCFPSGYYFLGETRVQQPGAAPMPSTLEALIEEIENLSAEEQQTVRERVFGEVPPN